MLSMTERLCVSTTRCWTPSPGTDEMCSTRGLGGGGGGGGVVAAIVFSAAVDSAQYCASRGTLMVALSHALTLASTSGPLSFRQQV